MRVRLSLPRTSPIEPFQDARSKATTPCRSVSKYTKKTTTTTTNNNALKQKQKRNRNKKKKKKQKRKLDLTIAFISALALVSRNKPHGMGKVQMGMEKPRISTGGRMGNDV